MTENQRCPLCQQLGDCTCLIPRPPGPSLPILEWSQINNNWLETCEELHSDGSKLVKGMLGMAKIAPPEDRKKLLEAKLEYHKLLEKYAVMDLQAITSVLQGQKIPGWFGWRARIWGQSACLTGAANPTEVDKGTLRGWLTFAQKKVNAITRALQRDYGVGQTMTCPSFQDWQRSQPATAGASMGGGGDGWVN